MAATTQASPLLALPLELRTRIYKELLGPDPAHVYTLYHDRHGRKGSFDIDPTVLRVNKQIFSEANSILYDTASVRIYLATPVVKQCTGGNYADHTIDPPDLFRNDTEEAVKPAKRLGRRNTPSTAKGLEIEGRVNFAAHGCIYPHCFQRFRKIQLVTSRHAIWGSSMGGSYFSHTGKTVLRIFKLLAEEQATKSPLTKRLRFTMQPDRRTVESQLLMRIGEMNKRAKAIVGLLKALRRRTDAEIEIEEGVFTKTLNEWKMEEAEVDKWDTMLMGDIDKLTNKNL